jgi:flagellar hook-associated protein 2
MITSKIDGVSSGKTSLAELGVSFGAFGAKAGSANTLQLDETKFKAALESDPAGVANVLAAFRATATLQGGGTGSLQSVTGDPTAERKPGTYTLTTTDNGDGTAKVTATFKPSDGGTTTETVLDNVTPGSTNTSLISGVTLTFKGALAFGTDTITIATPTRGIAAKFEQFLDPILRGGGEMDKRQEAADAETKGIKDRIDRMNTRLERERELLQQKFARMEVAVSRLNAQRSSLNALASVMSTYGMI